MVSRPRKGFLTCKKIQIGVEIGHFKVIQYPASFRQIKFRLQVMLKRSRKYILFFHVSGLSDRLAKVALIEPKSV